MGSGRQPWNGNPARSSPSKIKVSSDERQKHDIDCSTTSSGSRSTDLSDYEGQEYSNTEHQLSNDEARYEECVRRIEPSVGQQQVCGEILRILKRVAGNQFQSHRYRMSVPDPYFDGTTMVVPFGSYKQRTNIRGSDLDVVILVSCGVPEYERRHVYYRHLDFFKSTLPKEFTFQALIPAKVPVLKMWFKGIPLDIIIAAHEEYRQFKRDCFIEQFASKNKKFFGFLRLVKHWSKSAGVNDAFGGYLNSTCWTFLCVVFLKRVAKSIRAPERINYDQLLYGFFAFVAGLGNGSYVVDPHDGKVTQDNWSFCPEALVIIDPFTYKNLACALQIHRWRETIQKCQEAMMQPNNVLRLNLRESLHGEREHQHAPHRHTQPHQHHQQHAQQLHRHHLLQYQQHCYQYPNTTQQEQQDAVRSEDGQAATCRAILAQPPPPPPPILKSIDKQVYDGRMLHKARQIHQMQV